jgi:hypothetical protein
MGVHDAAAYEDMAELHPEHLKAVAIGSPGGWPIVPIKEYDNRTLRYPIGIWDIEEVSDRPVNLSALKAVSMYFYLGEEDTNDSVPYDDSYEEDRQIINASFGDKPVKRWPVAEDIYESEGMSAQFILYSKTGHEVTEEIKTDIIRFFSSVMR